jgi:hypothetical protein
MREQWAKVVEAGEAICLAPLCLMPDRRILPGQEWDLGHDLLGNWRGCEHVKCNRSAGAVAGNTNRRHW